MTPDLPTRVREALDGELAKCAGSYDACCEEHQDAALAAVIATRDDDTMRSYAARASTPELRAVLAEAERDGDRSLVLVLRDELRRRDA